MAGVTLPTVSDSLVLTAGPAVFVTETPGVAAGALLLATGAPPFAVGAPRFTTRFTSAVPRDTASLTVARFSYGRNASVGESGLSAWSQKRVDHRHDLNAQARSLAKPLDELLIRLRSTPRASMLSPTAAVTASS